MKGNDVSTQRAKRVKRNLSHMKWNDQRPEQSDDEEEAVTKPKKKKETNVNHWLFHE